MHEERLKKTRLQSLTGACGQHRNTKKGNKIQPMEETMDLLVNSMAWTMKVGIETTRKEK